MQSISAAHAAADEHDQTDDIGGAGRAPERQDLRSVSTPPTSGPDDTGARPAGAAPELVAVFLDFDGPTGLFAGFDGEVSGVFVATHDVLPRGTMVETVVCLPDGTRFQTTGEVRFVRDERHDPDAEHGVDGTADDGRWPGYGVVFSAVPADAREALEAFGAIRPPLFYPD